MLRGIQGTGPTGIPSWTCDIEYSCQKGCEVLQRDRPRFFLNKPAQHFPYRTLVPFLASKPHHHHHLVYAKGVSVCGTFCSTSSGLQTEPFFCPPFCHFQDVIGIQGLVLSWHADPLRILLSSLAGWILRLDALYTHFSDVNHAETSEIIREVSPAFTCNTIAIHPTDTWIASWTALGWRFRTWSWFQDHSPAKSSKRFRMFIVLLGSVSALPLRCPG